MLSGSRLAVGFVASNFPLHPCLFHYTILLRRGQEKAPTTEVLASQRYKDVFLPVIEVDPAATQPYPMKAKCCIELTHACLFGPPQKTSASSYFLKADHFLLVQSALAFRLRILAN